MYGPLIKRLIQLDIRLLQPHRSALFRPQIYKPTFIQKPRVFKGIYKPLFLLYNNVCMFKQMFYLYDIKQQYHTL
jgi:hypothetical protein